MSITSEPDNGLSATSQDTRKVKSKPNCSNWEILAFEKLAASVDTAVARPIAPYVARERCMTTVCLVDRGCGCRRACGQELRCLVRLDRLEILGGKVRMSKGQNSGRVRYSLLLYRFPLCISSVAHPQPTTHQPTNPQRIAAIIPHVCAVSDELGQICGAIQNAAGQTTTTETSIPHLLCTL